MENFFIDLGFSYTLSKLLPYILMLISGIIVGLLVTRKRKTKIKVLSSLLFLSLFFGIYFAICPIYEGDFSNSFREPKSKIKFSQNKTLTVLPLPTCPFCIQSTETIKALKANHSKINIEYWILNGTSADSVKYKKLVGESAVCINKKNTMDLYKLSTGTYPTFVLSNHQKASKVWGNDTFGVRAWDAIIAEF
jgi:hypothetical protein